MKGIFTLKQHNYPTREQHLVYPNPRTVSFGLKSFGYKATQLWSKIPSEIQNANNIPKFKCHISRHTQNICKCNLCKYYIPNLGYVDNIANS